MEGHHLVGVQYSRHRAPIVVPKRALSGSAFFRQLRQAAERRERFTLSGSAVFRQFKASNRTLHDVHGAEELP